jgi:hypothetical protein
MCNWLIACASAGDTPTGEDVLRFIIDFVEANSKTGTGGVLSYRTVKNGVTSLNKALTFTYENYTLTEHWKMRIDSILEEQLRAGQPTRKLNSSSDL